MSVKRLSVAATVVTGALLLSGCSVFGDDDEAAPIQIGAPAAAPSAAAPAAPSAPAQNADPAAGATNPAGGYWPAKVIKYETQQLGDIVVDGQLFTLYRFDNDNAKPSTTNCFDQCAKTWPPVLTKDTIEFSGIAKKDLGAIVRPDGTHQVTIGGWPIYRYSQDTAPGQATGQGVGGTWFVVDPKGQKAAQH